MRLLVDVEDPLPAAHALVRLDRDVHAVDAVRSPDATVGDVHAALGLPQYLAAVLRLLQLRQGVLGEVKILPAPCSPVEPHDRLDDAAAREPVPLGRLPERHLRREERAEVVAHATRRVKRPPVAGRVEVVDEAEHRVLHAPDVPVVAAAVFLEVVPDVAVRQLCGEDRLDAGVDLRLKSCVLRVLPVRNGRMHVLAPELGLPQARLVPAREALGEVERIRLRDVPLDACVEPRALRPAQAHLAGRPGRHRAAFGRGKGDRPCQKCPRIHLFLSFLSSAMLPFIVCRINGNLRRYPFGQSRNSFSRSRTARAPHPTP